MYIYNMTSYVTAFYQIIHDLSCLKIISTGLIIFDSSLFRALYVIPRGLTGVSRSLAVHNQQKAVLVSR